MTPERVAAYCRAFPGASEGYPFILEVLVFKVGGKIFAIVAEDAARISLKCDPFWAQTLRQTFRGVTAGYHLNKRHWNTVDLQDDVPDDVILEMADHSYDLVVQGLPRRLRQALPGRSR